MAQTQAVLDHASPYLLVLNLQSVELSDEQFYRLCSDNRDLRIELTAQKELIIMSPAGSKTGWRNAKITRRLADWAEEDGTGLAFDSSAGFTLRTEPSGRRMQPGCSASGGTR